MFEVLAFAGCSPRYCVIRYMKTLLRLVAFGAFFVSLLWGCSDGPDGSTGTLVIALSNDIEIGSEFDRLDITLSIDGKVITQVSRQLATNPPELQFPTELTFTDFADDAVIEVDLRGYDSSSDELRVAKHVETRGIADGEKRLLRVNLEDRCTLWYDDGGTKVSAPECNETTQTCISGKCRDAFVHQSKQEPYSEKWPSEFSDICKPPAPPDPILIVGEGQSDFYALEDYAVAQLEAGPQGGHHIWVATRIKNLHQSGSITEVSGEIPELGLDISPLKVIFTMDPDEGGYCKLYGLRFQVDVGGEEVETMFGKQLLVKVKITDSAGDIGYAEKWVTLSGDLI